MPATDDYLDKITSFHRGKPKFTGTVRTLIEPVALLEGFLAAMPAAFDLDAAIGVQLDIVGQWVGRTRFVAVPNPNIWFSFDDIKRGLDHGIWKDSYSTGNMLTRLDDETYRTVLRAKIAANHWDGTVAGAKEAFDFIFKAPMHLIIQDNQDMTVTFGIAGAIPSAVVISLLAYDLLPIKPAGVRASYVVTSVDNSPLFGFDVDNEYVSGFESGAWGQSAAEYLEI